MLEQILATGDQNLSILTLLVNMGIGVILSLMLMFHFIEYIKLTKTVKINAKITNI